MPSEPPVRVNTDIARQRFEDAVATHVQAHERFFLARLLGLEFSYADNRCEVRFRADDFLFNPKGSLHGGVMCLVMDATMGHLLDHLGTPAVTLEIKSQFMRPITIGQVRAVGTVMHRGQSVCYTRCDLFDAQERLTAFSTATWKPI